jgi:hypothetical protein
MLIVYYFECRYAECYYAECCYAGCRGTKKASVSLISLDSYDVWGLGYETDEP